jgi:hypothetical protein
MSRLESLRRRIDELEASENAGSIPTTDKSGKRAWIRGRGCGIKFMREMLELSHDGSYPSQAELSEDLKEQLDLWSRAEVDGQEFGAIARSNRELARDIRGLPHGDHA